MTLKTTLGGRFCAIAFAVSALAGLPGTVGSSSAAPAGFQGTIPTEANPITGVERLAKMRRTGRLPDTFVRGHCTYNLAGDPGVAYYAKTCR